MRNSDNITRKGNSSNNRIHNGIRTRLIIKVAKLMKSKYNQYKVDNMINIIRTQVMNLNHLNTMSQGPMTSLTINNLHQRIRRERMLSTSHP